ncbi:enoyl-CoA hydratase/isomerase family protein [Geodermatophilus sp. DSM 44513]|uniref:enoyl-CoA hydratase/isomerase family protein n=1 Tax=Geodermatophilus sp. DSM 44513 TaxID=1528104 RepID=UPI001283AAD3|nr:enoyl-CoA hydratase/isomerase family protein [Geodermatophilus sp. DSM 44513]WNV74186.1 enoyl-CoA hydratase/isomerase family protein [Geodermatophilus sp. DSM 44513]
MAESIAADDAAPVRVLRDDRAVTVLIDRPAQRNALSVPMSRALGAALEEHAATPLPLVLRSAVPGMFVSGTDVASLRARTVEDSLGRVNSALFQRLYDHPWPTVAVVDGAALGGGCELALACDVRITTEDAQWGLPEVRLGIIPSAGALTRLAALVGTGTATDLVLTGRRIRGREAATLGLASRVTTPAGLDAALDALLDDLGAAAPLAQRLAKEAMRVGGDRHRLVDAAAQALCLGTEEAQRRLQALLDRAG